ncbi:MAG: alpha/beta hydrolase [Henriciella sp.]|nr:alpha/beta hydrolase [Henriciella sp.]
MADIFYDSTDGLKLYARDYGSTDAPLTVLCMHGLTRNHKDFEPMIARLGDQYRYISVDVRGRGRSDRVSDSSLYNPMQYAHDMVALLDHLALDQVVLIGTSMGGLMSMLLMEMIPDRVLGVLLNDIGPVPNQAGLIRISEYATKTPIYADWQAAADAIAKTQSVAYQDYTFSDWEAFARRTCRRQDDGTIVPDFDPGIMDAFSIESPSRIIKFNMWRLFGKLKRCPLLILRGESSDILTHKMAERMRRRHCGSRLVSIPRRGHAPMLDEPEAIAAIGRFLDQISSSESERSRQSASNGVQL